MGVEKPGMTRELGEKGGERRIEAETNLQQQQTVDQYAEGCSLH